MGAAGTLRPWELPAHSGRGSQVCSMLESQAITMRKSHADMAIVSNSSAPNNTPCVSWRHLTPLPPVTNISYLSGALKPSTTMTILPPVELSSRGLENFTSICSVARPCASRVAVEAGDHAGYRGRIVRQRAGRHRAPGVSTSSEPSVSPRVHGCNAAGLDLAAIPHDPVTLALSCGRLAYSLGTSKG